MDGKSVHLPIAGLAVLGKSTCLSPSPVKSNTTAAHDRLSGVMAVLTSKEKPCQ